MIDAEIPCGTVILEGDLRIPEIATGLIIFAHGSGSSRLSPRNQFVGQRMRDHGFATLLFDTLTDSEAEARASSADRKCDLAQLTRRLICAIRWARAQSAVGHLPIGLFGSSTGAAAALTAAAMLPGIYAIVSRGGRSDLAVDRLDQVTAPTLLIAGGQDHPILQRNRDSLRHLQGIAKIATIPGAGHLFEERGSLEEASRVAARWFARYLRQEDDNNC